MSMNDKKELLCQIADLPVDARCRFYETLIQNLTHIIDPQTMDEFIQLSFDDFKRGRKA